MSKNIFLFIFSVFAGAASVVLAYLYAAPMYTPAVKPLFPKTKFSIENPPSKSVSGEVTNISGNVAWMARASELAKSINSETKVVQGDEVDTLGDGHATINFEKSVTINADSDTQVSLIQTLPVNFVFDQGKGSATYEKLGDIPISVRTFDLLINIDSGKASINSDPTTIDVSIYVASGAATVAFNDTDNLTNIVHLNAGDEYFFNNDTKIGKLK